MTSYHGDGKKKGLQAVAGPHGVIAALAIDQRSALRKLFGKTMGIAPDSVPGETLVQFQEAVSRALTPHATAILLDPEYGLSAVREKAKSAGLLLAYEKTGFDKNVPGRIPELLDNWSARRLVEAGADVVKVLLYYSKTSETGINQRKHAFVERIGAECAGLDVPFFLELVNYGEGLDDKGADFARIKPEVVAQAMEEFSKPHYRVDALKVGVPVSMDFVEGSPSAGKEILYTHKEAIGHYRRAAACARVPFIYLSQGVNNETFLYALDLAEEAGVNFSGVLCGRATWQDGVGVLVKSGRQALEEWLHEEGVKNIENVNRHLSAAHSCFSWLHLDSVSAHARKKGRARA
jgi:tagatose 1,6-diphosphate aldolase